MNKKAFTVIELLAVIAILSILLIISVPTIYKSLKASNDELAEVNAKNYVQIVEKLMMKKELAGEPLNKETQYDVIGLNNEINKAGILPTKGFIITSKNSTVYEAELCIRNVKVKYDSQKYTIIARSC